jgi:hypothetical protein
MMSCSGSRSRHRSSIDCTLYNHLIKSRTMQRHSLKSLIWSRKKRRRDTVTTNLSSTCSMKYVLRCITRFQIINEGCSSVMIFLFLIKLSDIDSIHVVDFIDKIILSILFINVVSLFLFIVHVIFLSNNLTSCLLMCTCFSSS